MKDLDIYTSFMYNNEYYSYKNIDYICDSMFCYINQNEISEDIEHFLMKERHKLSHPKVRDYRELIRKINTGNEYETIF
ncbi:MAG: hypothetical protein QXF12_03975 [Candidatus Aenigmatarchaeota archaeon]